MVQSARVYVDDSDERVVAAARDGDMHALEHLLNKYRDFVRFRARNYFMVGGDRDDVFQEGMIGLYKAIRDFRVEKLSSFRAFADLCITRQIITAIKMATRMKHKPLNNSVSLNRPAFRDSGEHTLLDVLKAPKSTNIEEIVIRETLSEDIRERMGRNLSALESQVLSLYLEGKSYQEMSRELNRHTKSIDNALQRIKRKIETNLSGLSLT